MCILKHDQHISRTVPGFLATQWNQEVGASIKMVPTEIYPHSQAPGILPREELHWGWVQASSHPTFLPVPPPACGLALSDV